MCGIAGALDWTGQGDDPPRLPIVSKLPHWDSQATVRVQPRRVLREEEAAGKLFFTPESAGTFRRTRARSGSPARRQTRLSDRSSFRKTPPTPLALSRSCLYN